MSDVTLFRATDGQIELKVQFSDDTVWLSQKQLATLFDKDLRTINEHIGHIYAEGELAQAATLRYFRRVQTEGKRQIERNIAHYDLDVIISVGYRVHSKRGTEFRQWATQRLRDHLLNGYTLNQTRLAERGMREFVETVELLQKTLTHNALINEVGKETLALITDYAKTWHLLLAYDEDSLALPSDGQSPQSVLDYAGVCEAIQTLKTALISREEATDLFGQERDEGLKGILGNLEQTFDGQPLYATVEARAAHLLYFVIKDHPFADGNKRIGCFLFLFYLKQQQLPLALNDSGLVALALLIAESTPTQKALMIRLIMHLLKG